MKKKPPNELIGCQGHHFLLVIVAIVLVAELHLAIFDVEQAIVRYGDAVSIASHVVEYLLGSSKGRFGIDDPFCLPQRSENSTAAIIEAIIARVRLGRSRSQTRRQLAVISAREGQDIGTCWSEIANEVAKPFWRK